MPSRVAPAGALPREGQDAADAGVDDGVHDLRHHVQPGRAEPEGARGDAGVALHLPPGRAVPPGHPAALAVGQLGAPVGLPGLLGRVGRALALLRTKPRIVLLLCRQLTFHMVLVAQVCFVLQEADLVLLARVSGGKRSIASIALDAAVALLGVVRSMLACIPQLSGCEGVMSWACRLCGVQAGAHWDVRMLVLGCKSACKLCQPLL